MALLNPSDITQILEAVKLVTDQFFVSPVEYRRTIGSVDTWQEDRALAYDVINMLGLLETNGDDNSEDDDGGSDFKQVNLSFSVEDFIVLGIWNATENKAILNEVTDRFIFKGEEYKVDKISYDGPLQDQPVLVLIKGSKLAPTR